MLQAAPCAGKASNRCARESRGGTQLAMNEPSVRTSASGVLGGTARTRHRARARELGLAIGKYPCGHYNAITDVPGVRVGHCTLIRETPRGRAVRTGVTAILPNDGNVFEERVIGSAFVLNGSGEVSGLTQVTEWGLIETPILLTNTLSVGAACAGAVRYLVRRNPGIGSEHDVLIPVVGECDDSWLNDAAGHHIHSRHVYAALEAAAPGPVAEGSVGGGTGMVTCDFKAGIGTASRKLPLHLGGYTLGVLVMSNFGRMSDLRIDGVPVGEKLVPRYARRKKRVDNYGSIIAVVATDAPLLAQQIGRLCKRSALGIGRVGSHAGHGSGEIVLGFSTANRVPRQTRKMIYRMKVLLDRCIDPLYAAVVEATEEAIVNALFAADTMVGRSGHVAPGLPVNDVVEMVKRSRMA
jgi:D-aminopeptidase